jgi:hypothetical protein
LEAFKKIIFLKIRHCDSQKGQLCAAATPHVVLIDNAPPPLPLATFSEVQLQYAIRFNA